MCIRDSTHTHTHTHTLAYTLTHKIENLVEEINNTGNVLCFYEQNSLKSDNSEWTLLEALEIAVGKVETQSPSEKEIQILL